MTATEFTAALKLPEATLSAISTLAFPEDHKELKSLFFQNPKEFLRRTKEYHGLVLLKLYLDWAVDTKRKYDQLGIPEIYFWDSMQDIRIWCEDYLQKNGMPGFREAEWVGRSLRLEVIRIGRLQFEPILLSQNVTLGGNTFTAGTPILDVHIPAGEPITPEATLDSMSRAPEFFRTYFNQEFPLLHCHSWLLSPALKELLPECSRIIQFQNLFSVYKTDNEERQAEERIFGLLSDNPRDYPENTSLQRTAKQYLLNNHKILMGAGVRKTN